MSPWVLKGWSALKVKKYNKNISIKRNINNRKVCKVDFNSLIILGKFAKLSGRNRKKKRNRIKKIFSKCNDIGLTCCKDSPTTAPLLTIINSEAEMNEKMNNAVSLKYFFRFSALISNLYLSINI